MAAETVTLIGEELDESVDKGFVKYSLIRIYQTFTDLRTEGAGTAINAPGLPPRGQKITLNVGAESHELACVKRHPKRVDEEDTKKKWNIVCTFTNDTQKYDRDVNGNPTEDPEQIVPEVDFQYVEIPRIVTDAEFISVTQGPFHDPANTLLYSLAGGNNHRMPWKPSFVLNTALDPIEVVGRDFLKQVTVTKYYSNWSTDFDDLIDHVNDAQVTITQADSTGTKMTFVAEPDTLLVDDISKIDIWKDSILYFKARIVMTWNKRSWIHSEVDKGQRMLIESGQRRADGSQWTLSEMNAANPSIGNGGTIGYGHKIIEQDGSLVGDPVLLNGTGAPIQFDHSRGLFTSADKVTPYYSNWRIKGQEDFTKFGF